MIGVISCLAVFFAVAVLICGVVAFLVRDALHHAIGKGLNL